MLKRDLFLQAFAGGNYKRKSFVISLFALINEEPAAWQKDSYPFRVVHTPTTWFCIDPDSNELVPIEDAKADAPLFRMHEVIQLNAGDIPNLTESIETTYGRLLFNYVALVNAFGNKIPYINKRVTASEIEKIILPIFKDTPEKIEDRKENEIYVDEYLIFANAMFYLSGFSQITVPGASEKSLTAAPGIAKLKAQLLEQYKDSLDDPESIAKIDSALVAYDREYLKGDSSEGFLNVNDASIVSVRKKLYSMHGAEVGLGDGTKVELIQNSLAEGWDMNSFPAINNALRAGSFNRGAETMKGGEAFKWLQRASSNISVVTEDCGSTLGNNVLVTEDKLKWIMGFNLVAKEGSVLIETIEDAKKYLGKKVVVRSPMYCKAEKNGYCHKCIGSNLSNSPTGLSLAITQYGSTMMYINMRAMHGSALSLAKMGYKTAIF